MTTKSNQVSIEGSEQRHCKRWTSEEDARLLRHIKARPQNLHYCFIMVAEETGRTAPAVAAHWYQCLSKKPEALCFFTASEKHIARNRKNGLGIESSASIWKRLLSVIRNII